LKKEEKEASRKDSPKIAPKEKLTDAAKIRGVPGAKRTNIIIFRGKRDKRYKKNHSTKVQK